MTRVLSWLGVAVAVGCALADTVLKNEFGRRQICGGVYGPYEKQPQEPFIDVNFPVKGDTPGEIAVIIFDFEDIDEIGFWSSDSEGHRFVKYMCDQPSVYAGECSHDDLGKFIVKSGAEDKMRSERIEVGGDEGASEIHFAVRKTGYYCVAAEATPGHEAMKFEIDVHFQNPYGHLPGRDYPLILFHFVQCMLYLFLTLVWSIAMFVHRHSVLKVQKYITALSVLMVLEQFVVALHYFLVNKLGDSAGTKAMVALVAIWSSARLAFTFFLLLIVSCGYSVVHPSLGSKMVTCRWLGGALFVTATVFSLLDYYESDAESTGSYLDLFASIFFFPFVLALGINYYMTLKSLGETITYLKSRKQTAKVQMYRRLMIILSVSLIACLLQVAVLLFGIVVTPLNRFVAHYWQFKWFTNDGWPNIVFFVAFVLVMLLWRPSKDNMRYAMSTQLSQNETDADEFEIGSLHGSDDDMPADYEQEGSYGRESSYGQEGYEPQGEHGGYNSVGAQRSTMFDADANHELSDLEDGEDFEVYPEDRRMTADEDPLVDAPTQHLKKNR